MKYNEFLESKQEFANWIKNRIEKYGFIEDEDFLIILSKTPNGGRPSKEYHLSLDMAKEISMVENNDQGKEARRYFIQVEKNLKTNVISTNDPILLLSQATMQIREMQIKADSERAALKVEIESIEGYFKKGKS